MRILVVMDPPARVNRFTDTTVAIVEAALGLGHDVAIATPPELWLEANELGAAYHHALPPLAGGSEPTELRLG